MFAPLIALALAVAPPGADPDSDGDGLSDHQEIHKYFTDPARADSDGDGTPDGDWDERREYAYTVRTVLDLLRPFDEETIVQDDYQDARVLRKTKRTVRLEVIHYPFNTNAHAISADPKWRRRVARTMKAWIDPGPTSNWDRRMQKQLLEELAADGIDAKKLDDRELTRELADWLMKRAEFEDSFTTFAVEFVRGEPKLHSKLRTGIREDLRAKGRTEEEQYDRELRGKGMFENRIRGTCTSSAIYLQTSLRAAGLPSRTIICVPTLDASDPDEVAMIEPNIAHHGMRRLLLESAERRGRSWASHTFNEVWIDGRWRRLNYADLGQNILDPGMMGLMTHVHTYRDHADAGLVAWGLRDHEKPRDDAFGGSNPYSCVELSDRFGAHADVPNPEPGAPHRRLTVQRLYWFDDPIKHPIVNMRLDDPETAGHLVMHVGEGHLGEGNEQYADFYDRVDKRFVLRAKGRRRHEVAAHAARGYWTRVEEGVRDFYLRIDPDEFSRMKKGVEYELVAVDQAGEVRWAVADGVTIERPD